MLALRAPPLEQASDSCRVALDLPPRASAYFGAGLLHCTGIEPPSRAA